MLRRRLRLVARLRALLGPDTAAARQSLVALGLNSTTSLLAGAMLGSITATFAKFPGLLVLVPAAIGLRGNIFGTFGNRISTTIHAGTFRMSTRPESVLGQNVLAASSLTLVMSVVLAVLAKAVGVALGLSDTVSIGTLVVISVVGGVLASVVVLGATLGLSGGAVRYGWDLDNVNAPLVSTLGDVVTLPALWVATFATGVGLVTSSLAVAVVAGAVAALVLTWRSRLEELRRIVRESLPVLVVAGTVSAMAGIVLEGRFSSFDRYPALLVLVPAHLSSAGALGGILSGRLSSKLVLGIVPLRGTPSREARLDILLVLLLAVPVYVFNAAGAHIVARALGEASPGLPQMIAASLSGGILAMVVVVVIAYYGSIASVRAGVDPDTYGIPVVSSTVDFVGAFTLTVAIATLGIAAT
jgi:mgtE-like transporter